MKGVLALGIVAAGLLGTIVVEWRSSGVQPVHPSEATAPPAQGTPLPVPAELVAGQTARAVATILARPLVSPNRRPGAAAVNDASGLPRLTGVAISAAGKVAIFAGPAGGKSLAVSEGEHLGVYLIASIGADGVTIVGPQGGRLLHPSFDPTPPPARPVAPVPIVRPAPSPAGR